MRTVPSLDPVTLPVRAEKTFSKVKLGRLVLNTLPDGTTSLAARLDTTDGTEVLAGYSYQLRLDDLDAEENDSLRLTGLLDRLTAVLGLFYRRDVLRKRIWALEQFEEPTQVQLDRIATLRNLLTQVESDLQLAGSVRV